LWLVEEEKRYTTVQLVDYGPFYKKQGIKIIEIYPPESSDKNKTYRDAIDGKTQTMIDEVLTPLAVNFQNIVKEHRPVDESVDGVLSGKMFYAEDAIKAGLVDEIGNFETALAAIQGIRTDRQDIANAM
jgi:protease-4